MIVHKHEHQLMRIVLMSLGWRQWTKKEIERADFSPAPENGAQMFSRPDPRQLYGKHDEEQIGLYLDTRWDWADEGGDHSKFGKGYDQLLKWLVKCTPSCMQCHKVITGKRRSFCDAKCRQAYNLHTWGEGRPKDLDKAPLTKRLKQSLKRKEQMAGKKNKGKKKWSSVTAVVHINIQHTKKSRAEGWKAKEVVENLQGNYEDLVNDFKSQGFKVKLTQVGKAYVE